MIVLNHDGLAGIGDGLSVDCDFDHFQVSLGARWECGCVWAIRGIRNLMGCPTRFYMRSLLRLGRSAPSGR